VAGVIVASGCGAVDAEEDLTEDAFTLVDDLDGRAALVRVYTANERLRPVAQTWTDVLVNMCSAGGSVGIHLAGMRSAGRLPGVWTCDG